MHKVYTDFHAPWPHYSKVDRGRSKKANSTVIEKVLFFYFRETKQTKKNCYIKS